MNDIQTALNFIQRNCDQITTDALRGNLAAQNVATLYQMYLDLPDVGCTGLLIESVADYQESVVQS